MHTYCHVVNSTWSLFFFFSFPFPLPAYTYMKRCGVVSFLGERERETKKKQIALENTEHTLPKAPGTGPSGAGERLIYKAGLSLSPLPSPSSEFATEMIYYVSFVTLQ